MPPFKPSRSQANLEAADTGGPDGDANNNVPLAADCTEHPVNNSKTTSHVGTTGNPAQRLIGIEGKWYDITTFIPRHPGGDIIESYVGRDATTAYRSFHRKDHLKHRTLVGTYTPEHLSDPTHCIFSKLRLKFEEEGFFEPSHRWFAAKILLTITFLLCAISLIAFTPRPDGDTPGSTHWLAYCTGALFLAAFWQQCGFLMHDSMHSHVTHNRRFDNTLGRIFGTACLGISATCWRDEHFVHHALTNSADHASNFCDPQGCETSWAQNEARFPDFRTTVGRLAVRVQHITFLPLCIFAGRAAISIDSFVDGRRPGEWAAAVLHWTCLATLLSQLPSWQAAACTYFIASSAQGILHVQLLLSHYVKPFCTKDEMAASNTWYARQVNCTMDIDNPWWLDWFHGGLNFHVAHHLFPTMPRHNYRRATERIREACVEAGLNYHAHTWTKAIVATLAHLRTMSHHFSLDPR